MQISLILLLFLFAVQFSFFYGLLFCFCLCVNVTRLSLCCTVLNGPYLSFFFLFCFINCEFFFYCFSLFLNFCPFSGSTATTAQSYLKSRDKPSRVGAPPGRGRR